MDDGAAVPLFYQKRVPEVLVQNENLSEEFYDILEDENLDDVQQAKLEREFATELEVIRRDDRLETIAKDIVTHFPRRGFLGKGLMVAVDKFTAVKMYDKVQLSWKQQIKDLMGRIAKAGDALEKQRLKRRLDYMRNVEMAVVISEAAGEEQKFSERGLDIKPHRERMDRLDAHGHHIEYNFKDPQNALQLVFVCAMWLTGFDAPTLSTLYLDKPMYENTISLFYEACKPEILGSNRQPIISVFQYLRGVIDSIIGQQDVDSAKLRIGTLLDESVVVDGSNYERNAVHDPVSEFQIIQTGRTWNLSKINFDKLKEEFRHSPFKNIQIADLRKFIEQKLEKMIGENVTRIDFAQRFQVIIDTYNAGGSTTENFYTDLMNFARDMQAEDERHVREGLTEDELELFDLLKKDKMTKEETKRVKLAAKSLLHRLLEEHPRVLVQDWFRDRQSQLKVRAAVEEVLDNNLPDSYDRVLFKKKCDNVYELIFDHASKGRKWAA